MIRDDIMKSKMLAGRLEPTPDYMKSIHSTLAKLPARKAPLFKVLPVSAVVFVAVAILCIVAVNNKTVAGLLAGGSQPAGQQLAAGDVPLPSETPSGALETPEPTPSSVETPRTTALETPAPSPGMTAMPVTETAAPSPTPAETPEPTPSPDPQVTSMPIDNDTYIHTINQSKTINGITETVLEAGSDGFVLYVKVEFGPIPEGVNPRNDFSTTINGKKHKGGSYEWTDPVEGKKGYYTTITKMPLLDINSQKLNIVLSSRIQDNTYEMTSEKWKDNPLADYSFDLELTNWRADKLNAAGSGLFLYGNKTQIAGYFQSPQDTVLCLTIDNDKNNKLASYFNKYLQERGNGEDTVIFQGEDPTVLNMFIYNGYTDENILNTLYTPAEGDAAHEAFDALNSKMFIHTNMLLKRNDNGTFTLYIISMSLQPASELTLISSYYTSTEDSSSPLTANATNYVVHVKLG